MVGVCCTPQSSQILFPGWPPKPFDICYTERANLREMEHGSAFRQEETRIMKTVQQTRQSCCYFYWVKKKYPATSGRCFTGRKVADTDTASQLNYLFQHRLTNQSALTALRIPRSVFLISYLQTVITATGRAKMDFPPLVLAWSVLHLKK